MNHGKFQLTNSQNLFGFFRAVGVFNVEDLENQLLALFPTQDYSTTYGHFIKLSFLIALRLLILNIIAWIAVYNIFMTVIRQRVVRKTVLFSQNNDPKGLCAPNLEIQDSELSEVDTTFPHNPNYWSTERKNTCHEGKCTPRKNTSGIVEFLLDWC